MDNLDHSIIVGPRLDSRLAQGLQGRLVRPLWQRFPDGECSCELPLDLFGQSVVVVESMSPQPAQSLVDLGLLLDSLNRLNCRTQLVLTYMAYARQDRSGRPGHPLSSQLVGHWLSRLGLQRVAIVDPHSEVIENGFDCPVSILSALPLLQNAIRGADLVRPVVCAPDFGRAKEAAYFADGLGWPLAIVDKVRRSEGLGVRHFFGDVTGRDVVLYDDLLATGGTLRQAAQKCREAGARRVFACVTHTVLQEGARAGLQDGLDHLWTTDSISQPSLPDGISVVSIAPVINALLELIQGSQR